MRAVIRSSDLSLGPGNAESPDYWSRVDAQRNREVIALLNNLNNRRGAARQVNMLAPILGIGGVLIDDDWRFITDLSQDKQFIVFGEERIPTVYDRYCEWCKALKPDFWHLKDTHVSGKGSGAGVSVAVLDSGVSIAHQDLIHHAQNAKVGIYRDKDWKLLADPKTAKDEDGHGTSICSLIAGKSAGMAARAQLAVACAGKDPPAWLMASAVGWLVHTDFGSGQLGCDVLNLSVGINRDGIFDDRLLNILLEAWQKYGTVVVAAVGNASFSDPGYHQSPGNYEFLVSVGALDSGSAMIRLSAWGQVNDKEYLKPDLCAPGCDVWSADSTGGYIPGVGTSLSAAVVSGACAVVIERHKLRRQPDEVKKVLIGAVRPLETAYARPTWKQSELAQAHVGGAGCLDFDS